MSHSDDPTEDPDLQLAIAMSLQQDEDFSDEQTSAAASTVQTDQVYIPLGPLALYSFKLQDKQ